MKKLNIRTITFAGVLIAMNLILTRVLAIDIGTSMRINVGMTPLFLASLWFGPVVGGICGLSADLLGCLMDGFAPNPFISMTAVLAGVLPYIFKQYVFHSRMNAWKITVVLAVHGLIGSLGFTTLGLHIYYGTPWSVLYAGRIPQTIALVIANTILVSILYQSALTKFVNNAFTNLSAKSR